MTPAQVVSDVKMYADSKCGNPDVAENPYALEVHASEPRPCGISNLSGESFRRDMDRIRQICTEQLTERSHEAVACTYVEARPHEIATHSGAFMHKVPAAEGGGPHFECSGWPRLSSSSQMSMRECSTPSTCTPEEGRSRAGSCGYDMWPTTCTSSFVNSPASQRVPSTIPSPMPCSANQCGVRPAMVMSDVPFFRRSSSPVSKRCHSVSMPHLPLLRNAKCEPLTVVMTKAGSGSQRKLAPQSQSASLGLPQLQSSALFVDSLLVIRNQSIPVNTSVVNIAHGNDQSNVASHHTCASARAPAVFTTPLRSSRACVSARGARTPPRPRRQHFFINSPCVSHTCPLEASDVPSRTIWIDAVCVHADSPKLSHPALVDELRDVMVVRAYSEPSRCPDSAVCGASCELPAYASCVGASREDLEVHTLQASQTPSMSDRGVCVASHGILCQGLRSPTASATECLEQSFRNLCEAQNHAAAADVASMCCVESQPASGFDEESVVEDELTRSCVIRGDHVFDASDATNFVDLCGTHGQQLCSIDPSSFVATAETNAYPFPDADVEHFSIATPHVSPRSLNLRKEMHGFAPLQRVEQVKSKAESLQDAVNAMRDCLGQASCTPASFDHLVAGLDQTAPAMSSLVASLHDGRQVTQSVRAPCLPRNELHVAESAVVEDRLPSDSAAIAGANLAVDKLSCATKMLEVGIVSRQRVLDGVQQTLWSALSDATERLAELSVGERSICDGGLPELMNSDHAQLTQQGQCPVTVEQDRKPRWPEFRRRACAVTSDV